MALLGRQLDKSRNTASSVLGRCRLKKTSEIPPFATLYLLRPVPVLGRCCGKCGRHLRGTEVNHVSPLQSLKLERGSWGKEGICI
jgi:hypothetical protein